MKEIDDHNDNNSKITEDDVNWSDEVSDNGECIESSELIVLAKEKKRPVQINKYSEKEKTLAYERHKEDLLFSIYAIKEYATAARNDHLKAVMLSLLNIDNLDVSSTMPDQLKKALTTFRNLGFHCAELRIWIHESPSMFSTEGLVELVLSDRIATKKQLLVILMAFLNIVGIPTRIVGNILPCSLNPKSHLDIVGRTSKESSSSNITNSNSSSNSVETDKEKSIVSMWLEVNMSDRSTNSVAGDWQHLDVLVPKSRCRAKYRRSNVSSTADEDENIENDEHNNNNNNDNYNKKLKLQFIFNQSAVVEQLQSRGRAVLYAIAVDDFGNVIDVTDTYTENSLSASKLKGRLPPMTLQSLLVSCGNKELKSPEKDILKRKPICVILEDETDNDIADEITTTSSSSQHKRIRSHYEAAEDLQPLPPLPQSLLQFKQHPHYVLERFLLFDQYISSDTSPHSIFQGERVFLRSDIENLKTSSQWFHENKVVSAGEEPVKYVDVGLLSSSMTKKLGLFGAWQTEDRQESVVVDGVIPVNRYGNVEVWDYNDKFVPKGAVFVAGNSLIALAKRLGLPHAPALVGFDVRPGRFMQRKKIPKFGGVVVLEEHEQLLAEAMTEIGIAKQEKLALKKSNTIYSKWKIFIQRMLIQKRLKDTYG